MLKGCQNSLAVQECTQETADQMLHIKTAHQSQLRAALKRRIQMPHTPFVNITCRGAGRQGEGYQSPSTWEMLPSSQAAQRGSCGTVRRLWELWMETTCEHTPLGRAPCVRQRADHQLTPCVEGSWGVWLVWEPNRSGGRKVPTLWKEPGTWRVCLLRGKNPTPENVLEKLPDKTKWLLLAFSPAVYLIWSWGKPGMGFCEMENC